MKVKFLRDYHGPETNEFRHLQGAVVEFPDEVAENFIARKIVVSVEPEPIEVEPEIEAVEEVVEVEQPITEVFEQTEADEVIPPPLPVIEVAKNAKGINKLFKNKK